MPAVARIPTLAMRLRSGHDDFHIREKHAGDAEPSAHRHEYFQLQVNLGDATTQRIGEVERRLSSRGLAFILPHRVHQVNQTGDSRALLINFEQRFLLPQLDCSPLELEDVALAQAPELAPFLFQPYLDFALDGRDWRQALRLLADMRRVAGEPGLGSREYLRGGLLQLIGLVCRAHAPALQALAAGSVQRRSRRDALGRMRRYVREHLDDSALDLKAVAAATCLSPNYLTHWLRRETGQSFSELVLHARMHRARQLLLDTPLSIGEVARRCGFADEAYFSRRFRQSHGLPPGRFRREGGARPADGNFQL